MIKNKNNKNILNKIMEVKNKNLIWYYLNENKKLYFNSFSSVLES